MDALEVGLLLVHPVELSSLYTASNLGTVVEACTSVLNKIGLVVGWYLKLNFYTSAKFSLTKLVLGPNSRAKYEPFSKFMIFNL